jgi:hypothetical protein
MKLGNLDITDLKIGTTNINEVRLGTTLIWSRSTVDPDAQAFITAANITNATQQGAINQLVIDLKGYGIWAKMKAIYPFVGGTASTHKFNLKDPRDLDVAFRLQFFGGITHSSTGALPNGTTGYADTFFSPALQINITDSVSLGIYIRTQSVDSTQQFDMAVAGAGLSGSVGELTLSTAFTNTNPLCQFAAEFLSSQTYTFRRASIIDTNTQGFFAGSQNINTMLFYKNGVTVNPTLDNKLSSRDLPNRNLTIFAQRNFTTMQRFTKRELAFAFMGTQLTATELTNYYTAVQAFQTTLNRQV